MSFSIKSFFGIEGTGLANSVKTAAQAVFRPLLPEQVTVEIVPHFLGTEMMHDLSKLWSDIQQESPSQSAYALRDFILKSVQSTHLYTESSNFAKSIAENVPSIHDIFGNVNSEDENITETFGGFEDFSDVIKDLIKSMKVLATFEVTSNVQEDLHIPHFNVQAMTNLRPKNPARRYIGRV